MLEVAKLLNPREITLKMKVLPPYQNRGKVITCKFYSRPMVPNLPVWASLRVPEIAECVQSLLCYAVVRLSKRSFVRFKNSKNTPNWIVIAMEYDCIEVGLVHSCLKFKWWVTIFSFCETLHQEIWQISGTVWDNTASPECTEWPYYELKMNSFSTVKPPGVSPDH